MKGILKKLKGSKKESNSIFFAFCTKEEVITTSDPEVARYIPESLVIQLVQDRQLGNDDKICIVMSQEFYDKFWEKESEKGLYQRLRRINKRFEIKSILVPPIESPSLGAIGPSKVALETIFSSVLAEIHPNQRTIFNLTKGDFVVLLRLSMLIIMYARFKQHIRSPIMFLSSIISEPIPKINHQAIAVSENIEIYLENLDWAKNNHLFDIALDLIEDVLSAKMFASHLSQYTGDVHFPVHTSTVNMIKYCMNADQESLARIRPFQDPRVRGIDLYFSLGKQELDLLRETMKLETVTNEDEKKEIFERVINYLKNFETQ